MNKKIISSIILVIVMMLCFSQFALASIYNYATNTHSGVSIYYYGYVQIKSSYNDGGYHAARGYLRYQRKNNAGVVVKDSGRQYIQYGGSANDTTVYYKNYTFTDTIIPFQPKTRFYYGFTWVPHGSSSWPA